MSDVWMGTARLGDEDVVESLRLSWGVKWFVTGHQPAPFGHEVEADAVIILASDHSHGVGMPLDLTREYDLQGLLDAVVPLNQAEAMAESLRSKGLPVLLVTFPGEQHGFRKAATLKRAFECELYFYGRVFGFSPAEAVEGVEIENLPG